MSVFTAMTGSMLANAPPSGMTQHAAAKRSNGLYLSWFMTVHAVFRGEPRLSAFLSPVLSGPPALSSVDSQKRNMYVRW